MLFLPYIMFLLGKTKIKQEYIFFSLHLKSNGNIVPKDSLNAHIFTLTHLNVNIISIIAHEISNTYFFFKNYLMERNSQEFKIDYVLLGITFIQNRFNSFFHQFILYLAFNKWKKNIFKRTKDSRKTTNASRFSTLFLNIFKS